MLRTGQYSLVFRIAAILTLVVGSTFILPASANDERHEFSWLASETTKRPPLGDVPDETAKQRGHAKSLDPADIPTDQPSIHGSDHMADLQQVFLPDERVRISPTTNFPASAVVMVEKYIGNTQVGTCSGTFIGPNTVLTAGHCIYLPSTGFGTAVRIIPGKDGNYEPFGSQWASHYWIPDEWHNSQHPDWDWGILRLPNTQLGNTVGWFQVGALTTESLLASDFQPALAGYPGDKPYGTMWLGAQPAFTAVEPFHLYYQIDAAPGQSGAAVWRGSDGVIVGISTMETSWANIASRIDVELLAYILDGCAALDCQLSYFIEEPPPSEPEPTPDPTPEPTPPPEPAPTPEPPSSSLPGDPYGPHQIGSEHFRTTWERTDQPIEDLATSRTWMWGPAPFTSVFSEPYLQSPSGQRHVQYFDKTRMEITDPAGDTESIWFVTNGLLAQELITGRRQVGDASFDTYQPASVNVAGDANDSNGPTYASFADVVDYEPLPVGTPLTQTINRDGSVGDNAELARYNATAERYVPETNHTVASPFWEFMNSNGLITENGQTAQGQLFENPFYATGFPLTEGYWARVKVGGEHRQVLIQVFERRVLTYTPDNPEGWQVEAGNVGRHYYTWRYENTASD